jgi:hypothetical protein
MNQIKSRKLIGEKEEEEKFNSPARKGKSILLLGLDAIAMTTKTRLPSPFLHPPPVPAPLHYSNPRFVARHYVVDAAKYTNTTMLSLPSLPSLPTGYLYHLPSPGSPPDPPSTAFIFERFRFEIK